MPVTTLKLKAAKAPLALVVLICRRGLVQETGIALPNTVTVGCPGSLLHSMPAPVELAVKPEPDTVTLWPFVRLVDGVTCRVPEAPASAASARPASVATSTMSARAVDFPRRCVLRCMLVPPKAS